MSMTEDEKVDGPKVAAAILNRMNPADKERLMSAIKGKAPLVAKKIEQNVLAFQDIATLAPQGIQLLIKEISHEDLVHSLKAAEVEVKEALLSNMSQRKRASVEEDLASVSANPNSHEAQEAQRNIIRKLDELRTKGLIRSFGKQDVWV